MQSDSTPDPGTTPDTRSSADRTLLVAAGMFLAVAAVSAAGQASFLAAPAFVAAILTAVHAVFGVNR